jgi:hypothetical protein
VRAFQGGNNSFQFGQLKSTFQGFIIIDAEKFSSFSLNKWA